MAKLNGVLGFEVDFWKESRKIGRSADMMVAPHQVQALLARLNAYGFKPKTIIDNVAKYESMLEEMMIRFSEVHRSMAEIHSKRPVFAGDDPNQFTLNQYHSHAEVRSIKVGDECLVDE